MPRRPRQEHLKLVSSRVPIEVWRVIHLAMVLESETSEQAFLRPRMKAIADQLLAEHPELRHMLRAVKENEARRTSAAAEGLEEDIAHNPDDVQPEGPLA
jgi:hypothetical protein